MSNTTTTISAVEFAAGLSNRLLHCRELGHTWRPFTVQYDAKARAYDRQLRCSNCHTIRKQVLDRRGHVIRNGYKYVEGYLAANVDMTGSRDACRVESVTRFLNTHEQQTDKAS